MYDFPVGHISKGKSTNSGSDPRSYEGRSVTGKIGGPHGEEEPSDDADYSSHYFALVSIAKYIQLANGIPRKRAFLPRVLVLIRGLSDDDAK